MKEFNDMNHLKLQYSKPAAGWQQGLPVGNGRIGAVVIAELDRETWSISEVTYWSGQAEPLAPEGSGSLGSKTEAKAALAEMRQAFFAGDYAAGDRLAKRYLQPEKRNFGTNLRVCDVHIEFNGELPGANADADQAVMTRELDLRDAVVRAEIKAAADAGEPLMTREIIASHPAGIVAARFKSRIPGGLSFRISLSGHTDRFSAMPGDSGALRFKGQAVETMHSDGRCGVACEGCVKVVASSGSVSGGADYLAVAGADEAVVYFAVHTDYGQNGTSWQSEAGREIAAAEALGWDRLYAGHLDDFRPLFDRVKLELGDCGSGQGGRPTNERIDRMREGEFDDPGLFVLFFQYGRYLTIAGSREDSPLPMNLQGIWNDGEANRMAWSCDYHLDINTQMNYYPTEAIHLGESHLPLMQYVQRLSEAGREAAQHFYGSPGWVAHVFSNVWGFASPGWETSWGLNVSGGLWIAAHLMDHYEYSLDSEFLRGTAYPVLKEAAAFFLDYMTVHPGNGRLVTGPSNSPENSFYPGQPEEGAQQLSMGSTLDIVLVKRLLQFCLQAARTLDTDHDLQRSWADALTKLPPLQIGRKGQVQEWLEDYAEAQPEHRHLSHLYALYPGDEIVPDRTPQLAEAARITLENRMSREDLEDVEFTAALFALYFARLHNGEKAGKHVAHLIGKLCFDNLLTYSKPGIAGAESNIFVIDGNFGGTAAISEMLLQSRFGEIHLLPALPPGWRAGSVSGLMAKGNVEIDISWRDGLLVQAALKAHAPAKLIVKNGDLSASLELKAGEECRLNGRLETAGTLI